MNAQHEAFVSVDVETARPIPDEYSQLAIAVSDVDNEDRTFSCELKPISRKEMDIHVLGPPESGRPRVPASAPIGA